MIDYKLENHYSKAISYCLGLCVRKRYTEFSMREKLTKFLEKAELEEKVSNELKTRIMARLIELNYINDKDFARDYFLEKSRLKGKGKYKIINELKQKRINPEIISEVLSELDYDETEVLNTLFSKQIKKFLNLPQIKQKEKMFRFLSQRGFSEYSIYNLLNNYYSNTNDKD